MARSQKQIAVEAQVPEGIPDGHAISVSEEKLVHAANQAAMDSGDAFRLVGRIEAAAFYATVSEKLIVETFLNIKEGKKYKGLPYIDENGKTATVAGLDEFCEIFLKKSSRRCQELASNYNLLGPDLYEQAESIGFRQRDYNAIKALPPDDQAIVKQAIEAGKFDNAIELMQDMAVKHAVEKASLKKEVDDAKANYAALDKDVARKAQRLDDQDREIAKLQHRIESADPDQEGAELREEVGRFGYAAEVAIRGDLFRGFTALMEHADKHNCTHDEFMSGCLAQLDRALLELRNRFNVKAEPDGQEKPDWVRQFEAEDAAALAGLPSVHEMIGED